MKPKPSFVVGRSLPWVVGCVMLALNGTVLSSHAAQLTEAKFTQVVNDVSVISTASQSKTAALLNTVVRAPDVVRTGPNSRAELMAPDQTLTRVGANTVFSFDTQGRNINLQQGSVLFHSPTGKGGGTVKTGGAAAAVLGTTIMVVATPNGGFKGIVLEGKGRFTLPSGRSQNLNQGQLVFILPGERNFGPTLNVNLSKLVQGSSLVKGYTAQLPSIAKVEGAVTTQQAKLESGELQDTGLLVGSNATKDEVQVVSQSVFEAAVSNDKSRLEKAWRDKVKINDPDLPRDHLFDRDTKGYPRKSQWADQVSHALIAQDVEIDTPTVRLPSGNDPGDNAFGIIADDKLEINDDVEFVASGGNNSTSPSLLIGGDEVDIKDGVTIQYHSQSGLGIGSKDSLKLDQVQVRNTQGDIALRSTDGSVQLEGAKLVAGWIDARQIDIRAKNNVRIQNGSSLVAPKIRITAGDELKLDHVNFHDPVTDPNRTRMASEISLTADTIILSNVNLPGGIPVNFATRNGGYAPNPNQNAPIVLHTTNFKYDVRYGGTLIQEVLRGTGHRMTFSQLKP